MCKADWKIGLRCPEKMSSLRGPTIKNEKKKNYSKHSDVHAVGSHDWPDIRTALQNTYGIKIMVKTNGVCCVHNM